MQKYLTQNVKRNPFPTLQRHEKHIKQSSKRLYSHRKNRRYKCGKGFSNKDFRYPPSTKDTHYLAAILFNVRFIIANGVWYPRYLIPFVIFINSHLNPKHETCSKSFLVLVMWIKNIMIFLDGVEETSFSWA